MVGNYTYRAFGLGNGDVSIDDKIEGIQTLSKNNYRVFIPEATVMDKVYIREHLMLDENWDVYGT